MLWTFSTKKNIPISIFLFIDNCETHMSLLIIAMAKSVLFITFIYTEVYVNNVLVLI